MAAVFAIHPLRAESVAWVAERKDVLSGLLFVLTVGACRYVRRPRSAGRYGLVADSVCAGADGQTDAGHGAVGSVVVGLLAFAAHEPIGRLIMEKIPLLVLSAASCVVTVLAQRGAINLARRIRCRCGWKTRLVTCMIYLGQMFWPAGLAVFYPYPHGGLPGWELIMAGYCWQEFPRSRYGCAENNPGFVRLALVLVMLLPVIGLIQAGDQSHADRYTYLPQIGIYIALTWIVAEWAAKLNVSAYRLWVA